MPNLVPFEEIEAIILLSVCKFVLGCNLAKNSMLMCLSKILRNMATNKKHHIDNSYRSTSGLNYQSNVMYKYISSNNGNSGANCVPKMFSIAVCLYNDNIEEFNEKLWEGLLMSSDKNKQAFLSFLTKSKPQSASDIFWSLEKAEEYFKSCGALSGSIYDGLSLETMERLELLISNDNNFAKKNKGIIHYLKIGFSVLKEYVETNAASNEKQIKICSYTGESTINSIENQSLISQKNTSACISENVELKSEPLENNNINASSIPFSFVYYNRTVDVIESWADLYTKFMKIFWLEKGRQLSTYMGKSFLNELTIDIGDTSATKHMIKPRRIANNVYIETNLSYSDILKRIKAILDKTAIPAKRFSITYKQPVFIKKDDKPSLPAVGASSDVTTKTQSVEAVSSARTENDSPPSSQNTTVSKEGTSEYKIDFYRKQDLSYTKPIHCYCEHIHISDIRNWTEVYTALLSALWRKHRRDLSVYIGKNLVGGNRIDIGNEEMVRSMVAPKVITGDGDNVYIETNLSAKDIVGRIKCILEICHISLEDVEIVYTKKDDAKQRMIGEPKKRAERIESSTLGNDFVDWLVDTCGLMDRTAKNYCQSVHRAESIAKEQRLASQKIISADTYEEAQATYRELLNNQRFISMNERAHNNFTASINKYLQYLLSGGTKSHSSMSKPTKPRYDKELTERCLAVLVDSFTNGIKKDASIAKRKFYNAYAEKYGIDLSEDIDLDDLFQECALEYDGKFYAMSATLIDFICEQLKDYSTEGDMLFFYDEFYDKNISQFSEHGVTTAEMLKSILEKKFPNYYYKSNCFATRKGLTLEQVVNAAYGEDVCLSMDELQNRLPFIGASQILPVLSRSNSGFVRVNDGIYAMGSRVHIAQSDVEQSKQIVEHDIRTQGYSLIKSLVVEESVAENPEIPEQALQLVLFDLYLANDFSRNRGLISPLGEADSVVGVLSNYCRKHNRITLKEVEEYEKEFTGEDSARRSLRVVTDAMIRVSEDTFLAQVDFDVAAVDKAIEPFFRDRKIISLKNVSSFSVFPDVEGVAWNSYLLASYLRRYSERWSFIGEEHKKKSVGAIFDKSLTFDSYDDAIAQAVAESGIELTQEEICDFLLLNEYRLRKADFKDIISKAYQIRMREE